MTCPHVERLGVFALGIDDAERAGVERHVAGCADCRAELAELRSLPTLLDAVRKAGIVFGDEPVRPPDDLLDRVLVTIAAERVRTRKRRRRVAVFATAALLAGVSAAGVGAVLRAEQSPDPVPLATARSPYGVSATTSATGRPWGTEIDMTLRGLPLGSSCRLVARADDGRTETAASWRVTYENSLTVEGMTSIAPDDLTELEVVDDNGRGLLTVAVTSPRGTPR